MLGILTFFRQISGLLTFFRQILGLLNFVPGHFVLFLAQVERFVLSFFENCFNVSARLIIHQNLALLNQQFAVFFISGFPIFPQIPFFLFNQ